MIFLESDILDLDFTEYIFDGVELRSVSGDISDRPIQLLDLLLDDGSVVHPRIVQDQDLVWLEVVQVVL